MPSTIVTIREPLEEPRKEKIRRLMVSPEYLLLRDVVSAHCVTEQVNAMNGLLYPGTERAVEAVGLHQERAAKYRSFLDILDDLEKKEEEWFTVRLDTTR